MRTAFITGAAGFIGFHLAELLLQEGWKVAGLDGMTEYYDVRLKESRVDLRYQFPHFSFTQAMLEDSDAVQTAISEAAPDVIIHLAAQAGVRYSLENPRAYIEDNIVGTFNVMEAARAIPVKHLLMASTSSVYGPWGRPDMALFKFTKVILEETPIDIYNNGDMWRDFTYVTDLVRAVRLLIDAVPECPTARDYIAPSTERQPLPGGTLSAGEYRQFRKDPAARFRRSDRRLRRRQGGPELYANADGRRSRDMGRCAIAPAIDRLYPANRFPRWCLPVRGVVPRILRDLGE